MVFKKRMPSILNYIGWIIQIFKSLIHRNLRDLLVSTNQPSTGCSKRGKSITLASQMLDDHQNWTEQNNFWLPYNIGESSVHIFILHRTGKFPRQLFVELFTVLKQFYCNQVDSVFQEKNIFSKALTLLMSFFLT